MQVQESTCHLIRPQQLLQHNRIFKKSFCNERKFICAFIRKNKKTISCNRIKKLTILHKIRHFRRERNSLLGNVVLLYVLSSENLDVMPLTCRWHLTHARIQLSHSFMQHTMKNFIQFLPIRTIVFLQIGKEFLMHSIVPTIPS